VKPRQVAYRFTPPDPVPFGLAVRLITLMLWRNVRLVALDEETARIIEAEHGDLLTKEPTGEMKPLFNQNRDPA
jgi:hypothetical protein